MSSGQTMREYEINAELVSGDENQRESLILGIEENEVLIASELRESLQRRFNRASPLVEAEAPERDADAGYTLLAFDSSGAEHVLSDGETVDLEKFRDFQLSPRTTAGNEKPSL